MSLVRVLNDKPVVVPLKFDLGFDLDADVTTLGSDFVAPVAAVFDVAGFVDNFPFPPLPISGADILLASLTFTATSAGDFKLDADAGLFSGFSFVQFESIALNINVSEVSAPASLSLFAIALVGLVVCAANPRTLLFRY